MLDAITRAVAEKGYARVDRERHRRASRASRGATFYEQFEDKEDCFLAACGRGHGGAC